MLLVRRETEIDHAGVRAVHLAAFETPLEADLLGELRQDSAWIPELSLVAEDDSGIVGHVVCTRADIGGSPAVGLGPIGVRPDRQRQGVGCSLIHAVVGAADALGEPVVVLLGDPAYYSRFGFRPAADLGIDPPVAEWAPHFQVRALYAYTGELRGTFTYAGPFSRV